MTLSTSEAADLLGVHPSTAKRWLDGSGVLERTEGGHRRVALGDLLALADERLGSTVLSPFTPFEAHAWAAIKREEAGDRSGFTPLAMGWLRHSEPRRIGHLFDLLARRERISFEALVDGALSTFMAEIGNAWRSGQLRVADEHLVTQMMLESLLRLGAHWTDPLLMDPLRPQAIVACSEGNHHQLGAVAARITLGRKGWRTWYLGPDVPAAEVVSAQRSQGASLVCVSFGATQVSADALRYVEAMEHASRGSADFGLVLGGAPVSSGASASDSAGFTSIDTFATAQAFASWLTQRRGAA